MPTEQELDQIFLAAAERAGGIQPLLTSFFGFLHRRTDFYIEHGGVKGQAYDAGFAPGQAEAMVRAAFMAHPTRPLEGSNVERSAAAHRAGCEATLVERAREFVDALSKAGADVRTLEYAKGGHGEIPLALMAEAPLAEVEPRELGELCRAFVEEAAA